MLTRCHGKVEVPPRIAARDGQVQFLRNEVARLKAMIVMREKELKRLRSKLSETSEVKGS
jgi:hypothetical protein